MFCGFFSINIHKYNKQMNRHGMQVKIMIQGCRSRSKLKILDIYH